MRAFTLASAIATLVAAAPGWALTGPGIENRAFGDAELFHEVGFIVSPAGHGNVALVQGYLMVIYSSDGGGDVVDGGIEFYDVSDLSAPVRVAAYDDASTHLLREAHGYSTAWIGDRLILCAQGEEGVVFFDVTDVFDVVEVGFVDLPGITKGDYSGDWWTFWQAPYVYVAGTDSGLLVVDASDPTDPQYVTTVATGALAGVSPAQVFATGNLLVLMEAQGRGFATLDIANPRAPRLLRHIEAQSGYSNIFAGPGLILTSGNIPPRVTVTQVEHDGAMATLRTFGFVANSGGYGSWQDGFFHTGFSDKYVKADAAAGTFVGDGSSGREGRDEDFATVLGNVVFAGNDHGNGSAFIAHSAARDTEPPVVEWMHPAAGATGIATTSRFGFSFSDHIRSDSLTADTVQLLDDSGARVPLVLSSQLGLVNAAPRAPLLPSHRYTVVVEGVADVAGNPSPRFEAVVDVGVDVVVRAPGDLVSDVDSAGLFGDYAVAAFEAGVAFYVDRDFAVEDGFPERLRHQAFIQTRNNDKLSARDPHLSFTLPLAADVVVLYDTRATAPPSWLTSTFRRTGEHVDNGDTIFDVWTSPFDAIPVSLGGNAAAGALGTESNYGVVVVKAPLACALSLPPAEVSGDAGTVRLRASGPASATYTFQVGDQSVVGNPVDVTLPVGRSGVVVNVEADGEVASCSGVQIVHRPAAAVAARTSELVQWQDDGSVVVANADNGVARVDDGVVTFATAVPDAHVSAVAVDGRGQLWVLNKEPARVQLVNATTGALGGVIALPRGSQPMGLVFDDDGSAYVSCMGTGEVLHLSADGVVVDRAFVVPTAAGLTRFGSKLYVSRFLSGDEFGEVVVVDKDGLDVVDTIVLAYDDGPDREDSGRGLPNQLSALRVSADGTRGVVSGTKANTRRGLFRDGLPLTFESRTRAFLSVIDLESNAELVDKRLDLNDREGPQGTAWSKLGDVVFVAARGDNVVDAFDIETGRRVSQFAAGKAPVSIAFDAAGTTLAVANLMSRSLSIVHAGSLVRAEANHVDGSIDVVTVVDDALDAQLRRGKEIFYNAVDRRMSKDGYIACASCHLDGGHDGRTWDFTQAGEGLRNTITLQGRAGTAQGNVHWTANFDEIQDFENDIRNAFGGAGFLSDDDFAATSDPLGAPKAGKSADLDALAAYVTSLRRVPSSPFRDADGRLSDAARRGRVVFLAAGCQRCHGGPSFRDGLRHDVGTVGPGSGQGIGAALEGVGFDTPTLKGIFDTAPYFHDGSAADLDAVFARHGEFPTLSATDAGALRAYLLSIDEDAVSPDDDCGAECVVAGEGEGEGGEGEGDGGAEGEGEGDGGVDDGCGGCGAGGVDVGGLCLLLLLRRRRLRR